MTALPTLPPRPLDRIRALGQRVEALSAEHEALERDRVAAERRAAALTREREATARRLQAAQTERDRARRERDELRNQHKDNAMSNMPAPPEVAPRRLAYNKKDAAAMLCVSVDFFDEHIAHELRCVRRGRRRLYPHTELERWLNDEAERAY